MKGKPCDTEKLVEDILRFTIAIGKPRTNDLYFKSARDSLGCHCQGFNCLDLLILWRWVSQLVVFVCEVEDIILSITLFIIFVDS